MELSHILARVVFTYLFLLLLSRLAGKRFVSESSPHDLVLAVLIGDMADDLIWGEVSAARFVVAAGTLLLCELVLSLLVTRSALVRGIVDGHPTPLMTDGRPVERGLRVERLNENDLAHLLRIHGLSRDRWGEVAHARLEPSGTLSAMPHEWARPATRSDGKAVREMLAE